MSFLKCSGIFITCFFLLCCTHKKVDETKKSVADETMIRTDSVIPDLSQNLIPEPDEDITVNKPYRVLRVKEDDYWSGADSVTYDSENLKLVSYCISDERDTLEIDFPYTPKVPTIYIGNMRVVELYDKRTETYNEYILDKIVVWGYDAFRDRNAKQWYIDDIQRGSIKECGDTLQFILTEVFGISAKRNKYKVTICDGKLNVESLNKGY